MNKVKKFVDGNLAERLKHVDNLSQAVYKALSLPMENHNIWAVMEMSQLTLLTDDSILATQLRLEQQRIIDYFQQQLNITIGKTIIRMTMPAPSPPRTKKRRHKITAKSAKTMISIAQDIEDKELQEQVICMAKKNSRH
jgi:hypothetical protein